MKKNLNLAYFENVIDLRNKRSLQFTYLALTIVALIFFGLFAINPTVSTIAKLQKELDDSKFVDEQLERKIQNLTQLSSAYVEIQDDLPQIEDSIPKTPQAPILVASIQSVAKTSGITLISTQVFPVELPPKSSNKNYGAFAFIILGEGSASNISDFVERIVKIQRIVSLQQITLTKKADESGSLQISLRGSGYFKE